MTTQPHPEPQEASSLPVVAWFYSDGKSPRHWLTDDETEAKHYDSASVPLTPQDDAQSQLTALRAERDIARDERAALWDELAALKAAPVVDVEAIQREARAEALRNFRHEHGQDFADAKKWREWQEAQRLIEEEMPEGYAVTLVCSPGDWDLRFTDPECDDIRIYDYESTEDFIRTAVAHAKEHVRAAASMAPKETP